MLVDQLIQEVRLLTDEENEEDISDDDILKFLNKAQQKLVRLASRHYEPLFMREATISSFSGNEATIPEQSFGVSVDAVDVIQTNRKYRVYPTPIRHAVDLETTGTTTIPTHFALRGNKILLYPTPSTGTQIRVRYQIRPPDLVKQQGRITNIGSISSGIIYVDDIGSGLTTSISNLQAFINIIDGTTGLVKGTVQVAALDESSNKITIKTASLDRSTVFGQTVSTSFPSDIELDDYVCIANGTVIPTLIRDYTDYLIQNASVSCLNKLGISSQEAYATLKELENDVMNMWTGRPSTRRVTHKNRHWSRLRFSGRKN